MTENISAIGVIGQLVLLAIGGVILMCTISE
jgi:hypothetical protein